MEELTLRKCPGGYKREDVTAYIASVVAKYEKEVSAARADAEAMRRENESLVKENAKLFENVQKLEAERDSVSRAVISAQKEADAIRAEAARDGEALLAEKAAEARQTESALARTKKEIHSLRLAAAAAARRYEEALGDILGDIDEDEE